MSLCLDLSLQYLQKSILALEWTIRKVTGVINLSLLRKPLMAGPFPTRTAGA